MTLFVLVLNPILCSPLGFELFKVFLLTIPEDLNTNRRKLRPFGRKQGFLAYTKLETVWEC